MTTNTKKDNKGNSAFARIRRAFPYACVGLLIIAVAFFGSKDKFAEHSSSIDMRALAQNNFSASADQTAELYIVSELATSMQVSTASVITTNYDSLSSASAIAANVSSDKIERPNIANTGHLAAGVIEYVVQPGDSIASIAAKYASSGVTETMIRWSNNFKASRQVKTGEKIYVPGRAGFVHVVKKRETVQSLADNYGSTVEEIIAANSLELNSNLSAGMHVLIPNGELPETERPDYVAPDVTKRRSNSGSYSYSAQYAKGNRYAYGWCTWYAWSRRPDLPSNMGNARNWANAARRAGFPVNGSPRAGDIFVTGSGAFGHVGYVTSVNSNGTVNICDMNGISGWGKVGCKSDVNAKQYTYIHKK